jgi:signal transduction histidine kinase
METKYFIWSILFLFSFSPSAKAVDGETLNGTIISTLVVDEKNALKLFVESAEKLYRSDPHKAIFSIDERLKFSKNLSISDKLILIKKKGLFFEETNRLDSAELNYLLGVKISKKEGLAERLMVFHNDLAIVHRKKGNFIKSKHYCDVVFAEAKKLNDLEMVEFVHHNYAMLFQTIGNYSDAISHYNKSIEIAKSRKSFDGASNSLQCLSGLYNSIGEYDLAVLKIKEAREFAIDTKDSILIAAINFDYGKILLSKNHKVLGLNKVENASRIFKKENLNGLYGSTLIFLADFYSKNNDVPNAIRYFNTAKSFESKLSMRNKAVFHLNFGNFLMKSANFKEAILEFKKCLDISTKYNFRDISKESCTSLSKSKIQLGDFKSAYHFQEVSNQIGDYLDLLEVRKKSAELEFKHNLESKIKDVEVVTMQRNLTAVLSIFLLLAIIFGFFIYNHNRNLANNKALKAQNLKIEAQNKSLIEANEILKQFAYVAAHDLKEPLRNIGSFISLIQYKSKGLFDSDMQQYMGFVMTGVKRMENLLKDLLHYSTITTEKSEEVLVSSREVLEDVLDTLYTSLNNKSVSINLSGDFPIFHMGKVHLTQLLQNLIVNAVKFSPYGSQIDVQCRIINGDVVWAISDNGIGIEDQYKDRIFNLFQKLDKSYEGNGIGLTICKTLVEKYKGKIWFESEINKGTTFFVSIPDENAFEDKMPLMKRMVA